VSGVITSPSFCDIKEAEHEQLDFPILKIIVVTKIQPLRNVRMTKRQRFYEDLKSWHIIKEA
jgi:hypothetical protein